MSQPSLPPEVFKINTRNALWKSPDNILTFAFTCPPVRPHIDSDINTKLSSPKTDNISLLIPESSPTVRVPSYRARALRQLQCAALDMKIPPPMPAATSSLSQKQGCISHSNTYLSTPSPARNAPQTLGTASSPTTVPHSQATPQGSPPPHRELHLSIARRRCGNYPGKRTRADWVGRSLASTWLWLGV